MFINNTLVTLLGLIALGLIIGIAILRVATARIIAVVRYNRNATALQEYVKTCTK